MGGEEEPSEGVTKWHGMQKRNERQQTTTKNVQWKNDEKKSNKKHISRKFLSVEGMFSIFDVFPYGISNKRCFLVYFLCDFQLLMFSCSNREYFRLHSLQKYKKKSKNG